MPDLLSHVCPTARVVLTKPFAQHPRLAALAMETIASWSSVEYAQLRLFTHMLGGHSSLAAEVYQALDGHGPKTAATLAAANRLSAPHQELLTAIRRVGDSCRKCRDALAHGIWAHSPDVPKVLLLQAARGGLATRIRPQHIYVYKESDFLGFIAANERARDYTFRFQALLATPATDPQFLALCSEPEIAERLRHQRDKTARTNPAAPP